MRFVHGLLASLSVIKASETIIPAPKVRINLYENPGDRWYNAFQTLTETQKNGGCQAMEDIIETYLTGPIRVLANTLAKEVKDAIPREYLSEIDGLYRATHEYCTATQKSKRITVEEYYIMNLVYEISAFNSSETEQTEGQKACTSIMAFNNETGSVLAARNMDFVPAAALAIISYDVDFYKDESTLLYKGTTFFGYVGLWTAFKPKRFSVTMNERTWGTIGDNLASILLAAKQSRDTGKDSEVVPISLVARKTVEICSNYVCAFNGVLQAQTPAGSYVVVSGTTADEGALLTRSRHSADVQLVKHQQTFPENKWYLLQTNDDYFLPATDSRRATGHDDMDKVGSERVDMEELEAVLMQAPVNQRHTIYTTTMDIKSGGYKTVVHLKND